MMEKDVQMDFVEDFEDVARILFSPLFICDGILSQKAFIGLNFFIATTTLMISNIRASMLIAKNWLKFS